jgi:AraC-like DNA-binding protein
VPSRHRYYLPPDSPGWTFCWVEVHHPYIVERARRQLARSAPVLTLKPENALVASATRLVRATFRKDFRDSFELELALFELMLAHERLARQASDPDGERERLLESVRRRVLAQPGRTLHVEALAAEFGMSRSHFSHFFRAHTALTPARFITEVRLREAARLLVETRSSLKQIADACGFANVNHFSKVFRRFHQRSPGAHRRAIGAGWWAARSAAPARRP